MQRRRSALPRWREVSDAIVIFAPPDQLHVVGARSGHTEGEFVPKKRPQIFFAQKGVVSIKVTKSVADLEDEAKNLVSAEKSKDSSRYHCSTLPAGPSILHPRVERMHFWTY